MKQYNKQNTQLAKELRKNATPWERKLWHLFLKTYPIRFMRQKLLGNYIVDFYCSKAKLVIELDGSGHYDDNQIEYDKKRTEFLISTGLTVLRFTNTDIDTKFNDVCDAIHQYVTTALGSP